MAVTGTHNIENLYKKAAGLKIHKNKIKEIGDIIDAKFNDLLIAGQANAKYNGRDVIWLSDLPLTKAFRESMQKFTALEEELNLKEVLAHMEGLPPMYTVEDALEEKLTEIVGTLIYILANITKEFSTDDKVVSEDEHKAAARILNLMI